MSRLIACFGDKNSHVVRKETFSPQYVKIYKNAFKKDILVEHEKAVTDCDGGGVSFHQYLLGGQSKTSCSTQESNQVPSKKN